MSTEVNNANNQTPNHVPDESRNNYRNAPSNNGTNPARQEANRSTGLDHLDDTTREFISELRYENKQRRLEIDRLREENERLKSGQQPKAGRKNRNSAGFEDQDDGDDVLDDPHNHLQQMEHELYARDAELQFTEAALDLGITDKQDRKYFKYLVAEAMQELDEGEELSEEELDNIVAEVKARSQSRGTQGRSNTSFSQGLQQPQGRISSEMTLEEFQQLGTTQKGQLYHENPDLYNRLSSQMRRKRGQSYNF